LLEFITIKGWLVVAQKTLGLEPGDRVVYFPPDSVLPPELPDMTPTLAVAGG
jgi:hypothetical protein